MNAPIPPLSDEKLRELQALHAIIRDNKRTDYHEAMDSFASQVAVLWPHIVARFPGVKVKASGMSLFVSVAVRCTGGVMVLCAVHRFGPINFGDWPFYVALIGLVMFALEWRSE